MNLSRPVGEDICLEFFTRHVRHIKRHLYEKMFGIIPGKILLFDTKSCSKIPAAEKELIACIEILDIAMRSLQEPLLFVFSKDALVVTTFPYLAHFAANTPIRLLFMDCVSSTVTQ